MIGACQLAVLRVDSLGHWGHDDPMTPSVRQQDTPADQFREQVLTAISVAILRRRISGRELSRRIAGEGSPGWWSKRYNGELALTVTDLGAISDAINVSVPELLGYPSKPLDPVVQDISDFLSDEDIPRSVRENVQGALGHVLGLALSNQLTGRRTVARGRASVKARSRRG